MQHHHLNTFFQRPHSGSGANAWASRHHQAVRSPNEGFEKALVEMFCGWLRYADTHAQTYASEMGNEGVLGDCWSQMGAGLRGLLNGQAGQLDCGTLDSLLASTLRTQGFDPQQTRSTPCSGIPDKEKAALHALLAYSWWSEAQDWAASEGENNSGNDGHIFLALKCIADWIGWDAATEED